MRPRWRRCSARTCWPGQPPAEAVGGLPGLPHFAPKAKRVIYLFQGGAPSQHELWDYKPKLAELYGTDLPDSVRQGQRLTPMTASQAGFPIVPSKFKFAQHGESGQWISELMPHTAKVADELCFIKTMHTEAINHDPGMTFLQTGAQLAGRPSVGAWLSYGLGSMNQDLPTFVVMVSSRGGNQVYDRLWGNGFLPSEYQGVKFLSTGDPVLYLSNPGASTAARGAASSTRWASSTGRTRRSSAIRRRPRASPSTRWPTACRPPCRS